MESDNDSDLGDILDDLLANAEPNEIENSGPKKQLEELNFNFLDSQDNNVASTQIIEHVASVVHEGDADSSDEEDNKNFEEQKYSDYGRNLKNLLKNAKYPQTLEKSPKYHEQPLKPLEKHQKTEKSNKTLKKPEKPPDKSQKTLEQPGFDFNESQTKKTTEKSPINSKDVYSDPIFGLRLVTPLISSTELIERMKGRNAITVSKVKQHVTTENIHDDWVIAGVLTHRSATKTSQKGTQYCIWKLSDLGEKMNTVSLFLFSGAYKLFWKTSTGTVIGILNPNVMESKDDIDQATLSVDNAQKVMILGNSRDMGKCKSKKKNGEPCSNLINISRCVYCIYHVQQEYRKASKRSDIQSKSNSNGFSSSMAQKSKNPQMGIYSQGMSNFGPTGPQVVAKRCVKLYEKDSARLALLKGTLSMPGFPEKKDNPEVSKKKACSVDLTSNQVKKDLEKLKKLRGWNVGITTNVAPSNQASSPTSVTKKIKNSLAIANLSAPRLGAGIQNGTIDFSQPITKRHMDKARLNALHWIKQNGTLKESNPNKIRESKEKKLEAGVKRRREIAEEGEINEKSRKKALISDKFKEMMESKSAHVDLVEKSQEEDKEKYFNKLEMKERMEEKMMTTFKVDCKAVKCLICKYTSYSASDLCKEQKHPLRVVNAVKSFFKCADCGNRTISLDRIPSESCNKCRGSHWVRAAMMDEKKIDIASVELSIRGGEEKFIGSIATDTNINLLVPDSGTF